MIAHMSPTCVKAVVFDVFGTLVQHPKVRMHPYHLLSIHQRQHQDNPTPSPLLTRNITGQAWAQELGLTHLIAQYNLRLGVDLDALTLYGDVEEAFQRVRRAGLKIAVCSNLAQAYGIAVEEFFPDVDARILSYEVGAAKPQPAIYDAVCQSLHVLPCEILFIGDSEKCDFLGPKAHGMQSRWLQRDKGETLLDAIESVA